MSDARDRRDGLRQARVRSTNQYRSVNWNAPLPGESVRPDPTQGNILELQSTGRETSHEIEVEVEQRLRMVSLSGTAQARDLVACPTRAATAAVRCPRVQTVQRYRQRRPHFVGNEPWPTMLRPSFPRLSRLEP